VTVLFDTDVLIDVALGREPFAEQSAQMFDLAESGQFQAYIAWHSLSNFYYIVSSDKQNKKVVQFIRDLLKFVQVAETSTKNALEATELAMPDFEDALQIVSAQSCRAQYIVTRNIRHYKKSPVPAITPLKLLELI
jgi:predicted nucleic acid-binding protein